MSETASLSMLPASSNPYLIAAVALSMGLHFMVLHVPFFANLFSVVPLNKEEWQQVLHISAPITLIDEALKFITRTWISPPAVKEELGDIVLFDFSKKKEE